jgi:hypothetical protein
MHTASRMALLVVPLLATSPVAAQSHAGPHQPRRLGSRVQVVFVRDAPRATGELLAVRQDSLWLLAPDQMLAVPMAQVRQVEVRRPGLNAGGVLIWTLVGGLLTGGALTAACSSVEDASCGGVLPAVLLSWGIVGGITAAATGSGTRRLPAQPPALAPYARFPQGLPPGFRPTPP